MPAPIFFLFSREYMKLLVAFDSFKGSLSSQDAAEAFSMGWHAVAPDDQIRSIAIADGGEGTLSALIDAMGGELRECEASDPLGRTILARYGVAEGCAIVESAAACGITLISHEERNPLNTTTYGVGEIIAHALDNGHRDFIISLGGSSTNDGGAGMLRALGYRFLDCEGRELRGDSATLGQIASIDCSQKHKALCDSHFTIASDVDNPLLGERGATRIYAPQKGADSAMVAQLERGLANYAEIVTEATGNDHRTTPGAGAAGGLGYALLSFMGATVRSGIDIVIEATGAKEMIGDSDLIVTGEGRLDRQTTMGKAPGGVLRIAKSYNRPVIAVGGSIEECPELTKSGFEALYAITPEGMPLSEATKPERAKENLRNTASEIARRYSRLAR